MASSAQVTTFLNKIIPIAQAQAKKHGGKLFPSVCIAQACCESGYGTSPKMVRANAVYGIKVGKNKVHFGTAWKDKAYSTLTKECYDGKTYQQIQDLFRAYDNVSDSTEDYMDMLCSCSRYAKALNCKSPRDSIYGIKNGGYATAPDYCTTIMNIIRKYNLEQYDPGPSTGHNPYTTPTTTLKKGSKGSAVRWLQWELNNDLGLNLVVDGIYGQNTLNMVVKYQKTKGLIQDGIAGPKTIAALKQG